MNRRPISTGPRRGLNRLEAAHFVGVSPDKFDGMVHDGRMPRPKLIDRRRVWDVEALDMHFAALPDDDRDDAAREPRHPRGPQRPGNAPGS